MNQQLDRNQTEDASQQARPHDDPYAAARARLAGKSVMDNKTSSPIQECPEPNASSLITMITVTASLATIFGAVQGLRLPEFSFPSIQPPTLSSFPSYPPSTSPAQETRVVDDSGALDAMGQDGKVVGRCPLKHTSVDAKISGYTARVTVKQIFRNPFVNTIEARYRFPLSNNGAVDDMTMKIGNRVIKGDIKRREEAARIYEEAKNTGHVASLLDQERTNIFTQSIANLESGKEVEVTIKYTEILNYKDGAFKFVFPTVVGPRFQPFGESGETLSAPTNAWTLPGSVQLAALSGPSTTTNSLTNANRSGQDISINVAVDAGLPISKLTSHLHGILTQQPTSNTALVTLKQAASIPNRDFVLDIDVAKQGLKTGYVATSNGKDGYITVMVMPPAKVQTKDIAPRELIFLIDCSGSQGGKPIQKSRETLKYVVDHVNDNDTFQIITFNDTVNTLFEKPEKMTLSRKIQAQMFIDRITANGGTWMAPAVEAACNLPADENRLRIVSFMTDGYVGNDYEVIGLVKKLRGTSRWFPFGVGDSVNRTLIDEVAKEGGGESDFVLLNSSAEEVGRKFYERISTPVLTDVKLSTEGGLQLVDVFPGAVSDVWTEKPLFFTARYTKPGSGKIHVDGFSQGKPYRQTLALTLPSENADNSQIGQIWARAKIDSLMSQDWEGAQTGVMSENVKEQIIKTALSHHLLSQFTSFVAVDASRVVSGKALASVDVPLDMPQGVGAAQSAQAVAPAAVSVGTGGQNNAVASASVPYCGTSNTSSSSGNPVADKFFRQITAKLECLSCAAGSTSGSSAAASYTSTYPSSSSASSAYNVLSAPSRVNFGDIVLFPLSLIPAPVRTGFILFLTFVAATLSRRLAKQAKESKPIGNKSMFFVTLLFMFAMALAIGHWNILNYPTT